MNRTGKVAIAAAVAIVVAIGAWQASRRANPPAPKPAVAAAEADVELSRTELLTLAAGPVTRTIPLTGTLRPANQTLVRAKVAGEIIELAVREGTLVAAGQRIARIDPLDFEARLREREALLRSADSQLEQARRTRDNNRALLEKNFISQSAFDAAQSGHEVAVANRDAAVAQLAVARKALADSAVTAPMAGVVAERFVQVGEKVSPDARIVSIVDLSRMEIEAPVPAAEIGAVRTGQALMLRIEGVDRPQRATIARISPSTAAGTRSVPVWLALENRDPGVRAGLFAQGALPVERRDGAIVVPLAALRDVAGRTFVYRVADGRIEERAVATGLRDDDAPASNGSTGVVEIVSGLQAGDTIVGLNLGPLRAGSKVRVVQGPPGAAAPAAGAAGAGTATAAVPAPAPSSTAPAR